MEKCVYTKQSNNEKMEPLKLLETEGTKQTDWKQPYIASFRRIIEGETKKPMKAMWGAQKKQFENFVLKNWTDEETGEFELPTIENWESEINWAIKDEWFMKKRGCDLLYFLSKYGTFEKYETRREDSDPMLSKICSKCGSVMSHKRSHWVRYKNQIGHCSSCQERFAVNDVLNQIPTISNFIPKQ